MNINTANTIQQGYLGAYEASSSAKNLTTVLKEIPHKEQTDIKAFLDKLNESDKKDATKKIALLDRSNMDVNDLVDSINEIFQTTKTKETSSFPSSFSVYV